MDTSAHRLVGTPLGLPGQFALVITAGIVAGIGVLFPPLWFFGILGMLPLVHALYRTETTRMVIILGFVFGLAYSGTTIAWFWDVLPLDWAGVTAPKGFLFVGFSWAMVTLVLGSFFALFAYAFVFLKQNNWRDALLAGSLFTLAQYAGMWGFALLTARDFSLSDAHFSPTFLGYSLAGSPLLLQLASFGGVYMLTFIAAASGLFLYRLSAGVHRYYVAIACLFVVIALHYQPAFNYTADRLLNVALVPTSNPITLPQSPGDLRARSQRVADSLAAWAEDNPIPGLVVFPEAADVFAHLSDDASSFSHEHFGAPISFIDSGAQQAGDRFVSMYFYDRGVRTKDEYRKVFLVPQGEYTPWLFAQLLWLVGVSTDEQRVMRERSVEPGTATEVASLADARIGALFCSDILSPSLYRDLARDGAELFVNPASQAWFHGSPIVQSLVLTLARTRAVENDRFLLIAGNALPASVISNRGELVTQTREIFSIDTPLLSTRTLYNTIGDFVLLAPLLFTLFLWFQKRRWPRLREHI